MFGLTMIKDYLNEILDGSKTFDATYNLKRMDGSYNLLAELLSDKNSIPLIFVKFLGSNKATISQRRDYGDQSILLGYQKLKDRLIAVSSDPTSCKFKDICSDCGTNKRPKTCVMNESRTGISLNTVICTECLDEMKKYIEDNYD